MIELIALVVALVLGFAGGLWDLRTSDIPDEAPALMAAIGLFLWYASGLITGNWMPFILSACLGTVVFAVGWGLYKAGQWGGGDAALLAGIFYLLPGIGFLVDYLFNFCVVAVLYSIVYSVCLGFAHPKIFGYTLDEIKRKKIWAVLLAWLVFGAVALGALTWSGADTALLAWLWAAVFGLIVFFVYARAVERKVFRRAIPLAKLKIGDVLASSRQWEGVTAEQIAELRRKRVRIVEIKEGVRFGLVFPLALVATVLFGNLIFWLVG
jgi:Flp pilus assembly protein protease CpaA